MIFIIGAGGHGGELRSYLTEISAREPAVSLVGFIDENKPPGPFAGSKILGGFDRLEEWVRAHPEAAFGYITAVGDNSARRSLVRKIEWLGLPNLSPWTLRHPGATVGQEVEVGAGACLAPGAILTTRVRFGKHGILNVHASVSHDCVIGDFVNINPHAALCGNVRIGEGCTLGAGATVIDKVSIGEWTTVGAGAVVVDDLPAHVTAVGVPARIIKTHSP